MKPPIKSRKQPNPAATKGRTLDRKAIELVRKTALAIAAQLDQEKLLLTIIRGAVKMLNATGGGIYAYDSKQQELTVLSDWGSRRSIKGHKLKKGEGMAGRVVQTKASMTVADYSTWPDRCPQLEPNLFRAVIEVPLMVSRRIIGVLYVTDEKKNRTFDDHDENILSLLAAHSAIALNNATLFDESQRSIAQLRLLDRISSNLTHAANLNENVMIVLKEALGALGVSDGSIMIFDPKSRQLEIVAWIVDGVPGDWHQHKRFGLKEGIAGCVAQTGRPIICNNTKQDERYVQSVTNRPLRSILSVPIIKNEKLLFIINADSRETERFNSNDVELLQFLGTHITTMIESLRLREVVLSLSTLPLDELYKRIVESAFTLIGADVATLFVTDRNGKVRREAVYPTSEEDRRDPPRADGLTSQILRTLDHIIIDDAQNDERVRPELKRRGVKSIIGVPLTEGLGGQAKSIGVLFVSTRNARKFGPSEKQILDRLADRGAIAIAQARLLAEAAVERDFQQSLLASAFDAIIAIDSDGTVKEFNPSAERILGYSKAEVVERMNVAELYREPRDAREVLRLLLDPRNRGQLINYYTYGKTKAGTSIPIRLSASVLDDGSVGFFRDQTEIEKMRRHVQDLRELLAGNSVDELDDLQKVLAECVNIAVRALPCDMAWIFYFDEDKGDFQLPPVKWPSTGDHVADTHLLTLVRKLFESGEELFVDLAHADDLTASAFAKAKGIRSIAAGPLKVRTRTFGVMICGYASPESVDDDRQTPFRKHVSDAAIAIYHGVERWEITSLLDGFYKISLGLTTEISFEVALQSVLDLAVKSTAAKYGALGIVGPIRRIQPFLHSGVDEDLAKRLSPPIGKGLLNRLLKQGEIIDDENVTENVHFTGFGSEDHPKIGSFLGVPIIVDGKSVGNIYVGNKKAGPNSVLKTGACSGS